MVHAGRLRILFSFPYPEPVGEVSEAGSFQGKRLMAGSQLRILSVRFLYRGVVLGALVLLLGACDQEAVESLRTTQEGIERFERNDHVGALALFERAARQDPTNARAHHLAGLVNLQVYRDAQGALGALSRAAELEPGDAEYRYQYGIALAQLGHVEQARRELQAAVAAESDHAAALYRLGRLAEREGELISAINYFSQSIHADPRFEQPYTALGSLYFEHGRPQEAVAVLEQGVRNQPESVLARAELGRVYLALGEHDAAITYLRQAAEGRGAPSALYFNLGTALRDRWQRDGAEDDRAEAVRALRRAQGTCDARRESARCLSIRDMIRELEL